MAGRYSTSMKGWIKAYRTLLEWEWHTDPNMVSLWMHLLMLANYEDKRWRGITIKRGQLVTGRKALSEITGISEQSIRTCLERLKSTNEITIKTTNKYSIITICEFDNYQDTEELNNQPTNQLANQQLTNNQPTTNQQLTTTKEYKEDKNNKKKISTKVDKKEICVAPEFEVVFNTWLEYKRERRESYKSPKSIQACYNKLLKLADGNPFIAGLIVEQSMANNWAGLFPLKSDNNGLNTNDKQAKLLADGAKAIAALEAEGGSTTECPF